MACRIISALKANVLVEPWQPQAELAAAPEDYYRLHMRRLFWVAYILDRNMALYTGQEPVIVDEYCNLSLQDTNAPLANAQTTSGTGQLSDTDFYRTPWLVGDRLQLFFLKSKVLKLLHSVHMMEHRGSQLLRTIRELDIELEEWRASVPAQLRPTLSVAQHTLFLDIHSSDESLQRLILSLEYYHLLLVIHGASRRYFNDRVGHDDSLVHDDIRILSCLRICTEASRCTANVFLLAKLELTPVSVWYVALNSCIADCTCLYSPAADINYSYRLVWFYFVPAILLLFFNVIERPDDAEAQTDIDILMAAKITLQSVRFSRLSNHQQQLLGALIQFLEELERLGKAAMRNV